MTAINLMQKRATRAHVQGKEFGSIRNCRHPKRSNAFPYTSRTIQISGSNGSASCILHIASVQLQSHSSLLPLNSITAIADLTVCFCPSNRARNSVASLASATSFSFISCSSCCCCLSSLCFSKKLCLQLSHMLSLRQDKHNCNPQQEQLSK